MRGRGGKVPGAGLFEAGLKKWHQNRLLRGRPPVITILILLTGILFIVSLIVNKGFSSLVVNPTVGVSPYTLSVFGILNPAKIVYQGQVSFFCFYLGVLDLTDSRMREITQHNKTQHNTTKHKTTGTPQYYRLVTSTFQNSGILQLVTNFIILDNVGGHIEKEQFGSMTTMQLFVVVTA